MDAAAKRNALTKMKSYAQVKVAEEKCASYAGLKSARCSQEWKPDGSC